MHKILVIEDEFLVRANIVELLNEEGFETFEAENGKIGIDLAKRIFPDLIISDILMPEINGYEVLLELQKDIKTSSIPFIFLSALANESHIRMGMRDGADDYLTKPYKASDLLDTIYSRLNKRKKFDQKIAEIFKSITVSLPLELRNPLISVIGLSQIIKEDIKTLKLNDISKMAEKINASGYELLGLIEKFLQYNILESQEVNKKSLKQTKE